ncbi:MAG: MBL fold metallo-hydrolase [Candidatus Aminicenantales bacterium]
MNLIQKVIDPKFPAYVYAAKPKVPVFENIKGHKMIANLFMGEWMKILDESIHEKGRLHVRYRGGNGYVHSNDVTRFRCLEVYFIDVNQGDSILIQTPDDRRVLIDGGEGDEAHTFIRNKYNLHARDNYIDFEAIVATHSDLDHTKGLISILKDPKIAVKRFFHNGLFRRRDKNVDPGPVEGSRIYGIVNRPSLTEKPELAPLMKKVILAIEEAEKRMPEVIAKMKKIERWKNRIELPRGGFVFKRLDAADKFLPPYDQNNKYMTIEVLWPAAEKKNGHLSYPNYGDQKNPGKTVNGNSIVLCLKHGPHRILLTGDLNQKSMDDLVKYYSRDKTNPSTILGAEVYKAAHHGSQDFSLNFLKTIRPNAAVISSGDNRQDVHGHPRAVLLGTITRYSRNPTPAVFSTELAACYTPKHLTKEEQKSIRDGTGQVYEKSIEGIVHLRSDEKQLFLGTVHGRKPLEDPQANTLWKWDIWP